MHAGWAADPTLTCFMILLITDVTSAQPVTSSVKGKVKVTRPEEWIKDTLPVGQLLGVGPTYDHIFPGD